MAQLFPLLDYYLTGIEKRLYNNKFLLFFFKKDRPSQSEADRDVFSDIQEQYVGFAALNIYEKKL